jgi:murein DD-endopeptidase MepM/ murein hydrolase activator NlpD
MIHRVRHRTNSSKIDQWRSLTLFLVLIAAALVACPVAVIRAQAGSPSTIHQVEVGDTWAALSRRYDVPEIEIRAANSTINRHSQPVIGTQIIIPTGEIIETKGILVTSNAGGLLQLAVEHNQLPWLLASTNDLVNPIHPLLYRPILVPDEHTVIREFPVGIDSLEISNVTARPGEALALRATGPSVNSVAAYLDSQSINIVTNGHRMVGLFGTGAFYPPGQHELYLSIVGEPLWTQPWHFAPGQWSFEEITLTGSAAAIDSESIKQERERLSQIWAEVIRVPNWDSGFKMPLDNYLSISSEFGARRSYNGGPYQSYHEGLDFSAYGGTEVMAPADGTVVLAENLYVRGGAVIINHGLGLFSGTYHLQEVLVQSDQSLEQGQIIGLVGSTGLSTGNHLHWDLLVGGIWVSPQAWLDSDLACWVLEGWGAPCQMEPTG